MMIKLDNVFCLEGFSSGSKETCLWIKALSVLLDIGVCNRHTLPMDNLLLSHAHMDHAAGIAYYLSQRKLFRQPAAKIYVPSSTVEGFAQILHIWEKLEELHYDFELVGAEEGKRYPLVKNYYFVASPVYHRIPSLGYTIYESKDKLKAEYLACSSEEILKLKQNNVQLCTTVHTPILSYLGDCNFASFAENPIFRQSRYLLLECTFLDERKNAEHAKRWGHIHLQEITSHPELFAENQKIVLLHFSSRYYPQYVKKVLQERCSSELLEKILVWE